MGAKPIVATLSTGAINPATLNSNFDILAEAVADALDRGGEGQSNNAMTDDINMGGFTIKNVGSPVTNNDVVTKGYLTTATEQGATAGNLVTVLDALASITTILSDIEDYFVVSATQPDPVQPSGGIWVHGTTISHSNGTTYTDGITDATTLGGFLPSVAAVANTVVVRTAGNVITGDISGNAPTATLATTASSATIATTASLAQGVEVTTPGPSLNEHTKQIEIGVWNMDTTGTVSIPHGIVDFKDITSVSVTILDDASSVLSFIPNGVSSMTAPARVHATATDIVITRLTSGNYDNVSYNDGVMNRGWITIKNVV